MSCFAIGGTHIVRPTMGAPRFSEICKERVGVKFLLIHLVRVPYLGENFWVVIVRNLTFRGQGV